MVARAETGLKRLACFALAMTASLAPAPAQLRLTLEQAGQRKPPEFTAVYSGKTATVRGVVAARAFHFPDHTILGLQDGNAGIALETMGKDPDLERYQPGDLIEVTGAVSAPAGMVVIFPSQIQTLDRRAAPSADEVALDELIGFRYLGRLVRTEGRINEIGETTAGTFLQVGSRKGNYRFFLPHGPGLPNANLPGFNIGDKVAATGVANQYCTTPPYDRWFELLVADPSQIVRTERTWLVSPMAVAGGLLAILVIGFLLWLREGRLEGQRARLRKTYQLGERILGAPTSETILAEISQTLPEILGITRVSLYIYNRGTKTLNAVVPAGHPAVSISLSSPPGGPQAGAVACFHYRTLLVIPDINRSPFPIAAGPGQSPPKSLLFVPMLAQGEMVGVLELDQDDRARDFTTDEQTLAQHLGNQIGVAIRLLDQRSVQEQLFRTEKLAAVGRLISGVVNELRTPLSSIEELAGRAGSNSHDLEISLIGAEARKASAIVSRLVSFAAAGQGDAQPICITTLLRNLIEFRERDWKASGIRVGDLTSAEPLFVLGSRGQLEQAFLTLFVHAEQSLAESAEKAILIRTSILAKRVLVEISFSAPPDVRAPQETAMVLGVTRSVIAGHGGEVRLVERDNAQPRFEVELPLSQPERTTLAGAAPSASADNHRGLTALVIDPEDTVQRQLVALLSGRGYRVVPVGNADLGLELAHRMRFDVAFCSVHAPGLNWVELSERLQSRVSAFVLLADRHDTELSNDFESDGRFVMAKPVLDGELDRVLRGADAPVTVKDVG